MQLKLVFVKVLLVSIFNKIMFNLQFYKKLYVQNVHILYLIFTIIKIIIFLVTKTFTINIWQVKHIFHINKIFKYKRKKRFWQFKNHTLVINAYVDFWQIFMQIQHTSITCKIRYIYKGTYNLLFIKWMVNGKQFLVDRNGDIPLVWFKIDFLYSLSTYTL